MVFCFSIFSAVWRSHNLECLYIGIYIYIYIRAKLRPPCRRYRGGSSTKKIDNPKILDTWFFFQYFQLFGSHATSNVYIQVYIYIITVILWPNCRRQGGDSSTKIIQLSNSIIYKYIYIYLQCHSIITQPQASLYISIYIYTNSIT